MAARQVMLFNLYRDFAFSPVYHCDGFIKFRLSFKPKSGYIST